MNIDIYEGENWENKKYISIQFENGYENLVPSKNLSPEEIEESIQNIRNAFRNLEETLLLKIGRKLLE